MIIIHVNLRLRSILCRNEKMFNSDIINFQLQEICKSCKTVGKRVCISHTIIQY